MFQFLLDLLLPQKPLVRELRSMEPEEFMLRARKSDERAGKDMLSVFKYQDPLVKEAVWQLKYVGNKEVARLLGHALYEELIGFLEEYAPLSNFTDPLLIPIPLSAKRRRERGFNQCELLTSEIMRLDSSSSPPFLRGRLRGGDVEITGRNFVLCQSGLRKIKDTPSQTHADTRKKRLQNLEGCFQSDPQQVTGRNIILIDDVATTGATLEEARRSLLAAGARKVIAFTIAH